MGVTMRGDDGVCGSLFSYIDLEKRVRLDHPLRVIRRIANAALKSLSGEFAKLYSPIGRESIPPERLMRAMLLQAFYSIRSERQLVERIDYDLLFRWFVGLGIEDAVWDATSFTKNHDRLLDGEVASQFLAAVLSQDKVKRLLSSDHFSVDGTLLEAWASPKSFRPKDGSGEPPGPGRNVSAAWGQASGHRRHIRFPASRDRAGAHDALLVRPIRPAASVGRYDAAHHGAAGIYRDRDPCTARRDLVPVRGLGSAALRRASVATVPSDFGVQGARRPV